MDDPDALRATSGLPEVEDEVVEADGPANVVLDVEDCPGPVALTLAKVAVTPLTTASFAPDVNSADGGTIAPMVDVKLPVVGTPRGVFEAVRLLLVAEALENEKSPCVFDEELAWADWFASIDCEFSGEVSCLSRELVLPFALSANRSARRLRGESS